VRLVSFEHEGGTALGALVDAETVVDLSAGGDPEFSSAEALIAGGPDALAKARSVADAAARSVPLAEVTLRAPLSRPARIRDCTLFIEHLEPAFRALARKQAADNDNPDAEYKRLVETGRFDLPEVLREQPVYYNVDPLSLSGPGELIVAPYFSQWLDYELEIGVVLGRTARDVTASDAADSIFGYTIYNDWSLRDVQTRVMQSNLGPAEGKDFDGGTTIGPCLVTKDELDPYALEMIARVNGEEWSRGNSASMAHSIEEAIVHLSRGKTIHATELWGSGTVLSGSGFELGRTLQDGDVVELEVEGIGVLRNQVTYAERPVGAVQP
jgi:2-keto-4-pentenoate hydratase/2-oxohepta-3-ene-1,7-dioic acid hydratase in catechol pathway